MIDSMKDWKEQLIVTAENTLLKLQNEHIYYLEEEKQQLLTESENVLSDEEWENHQDILEQYEKLKLQTELFSIENWNESFKEKSKELLSNAAIIPADFREKLRLYLESTQQGFKVGGLFSAKKKTEEERNRRIQDVYEQYKVILQSQIIGHLKNLMKQSLKDVGVLTDERASNIDSMSFDVPFSLIEQQVKKDSLVTGDAVLNFANRVAEATKRYFIEATEIWRDQQKDVLADASKQLSAPVKAKLKVLEEKVEAIQSIIKVDEQKQFAEKEIKTATKDTRNGASNQYKAWQESYEQSLKDIRPFDPSMLVVKESKTEEETDSVQQTAHYNEKAVKSFKLRFEQPMQ